ncbi:MAG TPA: biotin/lipoyl-containing protein [Ilumatobacter sp.]|nr:biotin/lipoyl-containing protein [Ilumatobacter sp.]
MDGSQDAIKRVVEAFEQSNWTEIDVRFGDVRVHLATGAATGSSAVAAAATPAAVDRSAATEDADRGVLEPVPGTDADPTLPPGAHVVYSPSPGIVWRSPEPGAPPFAAVGDLVASSSTVCIVEIMKLMNHLKAGVRGEVVAVYAGNGVPVRKGQPLFAIRPSGSAP